MQSSSVIGEVEAEKEVRRLTLFAAGRDAAGKVPPREWEAMTWGQRLAHIQDATVAAAGAASANGTGAAGEHARPASGQIPGTHSQKLSS
jgi:hypothetical protein